LDIPILSSGGLRPWQGRLTPAAQFEQAGQNRVPFGFKGDLDIVDSGKETALQSPRLHMLG
jgi:hypothetical protein